jgi:hypothetical protein
MQDKQVSLGSMHVPAGRRAYIITQREAGLMNMHSVADYNSDAHCTAFLSHRLTAKILLHKKKPSLA